MQELLDTLDSKGITTPHDNVVGSHLAEVLSGGGAAAGEMVSAETICALEREAFLALAGTPATVSVVRCSILTSTGLSTRPSRIFVVDLVWIRSPSRVKAECM